MNILHEKNNNAEKMSRYGKSKTNVMYCLLYLMKYADFALFFFQIRSLFQEFKNSKYTKYNKFKTL